MKHVKRLAALAALISIGGSVYAFYNSRETETAPALVTAPVTRGAIVDAISATGTLQAVTSVQVARRSRARSTRSAPTSTQSSKEVSSWRELDRLPVPDAGRAEPGEPGPRSSGRRTARVTWKMHAKLTRGRAARHGSSWSPQSELDAAQSPSAPLKLRLRSAAGAGGAGAGLRQADRGQPREHDHHRADRRHRVVAGVDVGQTVAASMQAPTLFVIAADLTKMQVLAEPGRVRHRRDCAKDSPRASRSTRIPATRSKARLADPPAAAIRAERRHLFDRHRLEPRPVAEAGDDRERDDRGGPARRRAACAGRGAAVPARRPDERRAAGLAIGQRRAYANHGHARSERWAVHRDCGREAHGR